MATTYTPADLHPCAADGRRLEGQEFDGHDVLAWITAINAGQTAIEDTPKHIARCIPMGALENDRVSCGCHPGAIVGNVSRHAGSTTACNCGRAADSRLWHAGFCATGGHLEISRGWQTERTSIQDSCLDYAMSKGRTPEFALAWAAWVGSEVTGIYFPDSLRDFEKAVA